MLLDKKRKKGKKQLGMDMLVQDSLETQTPTTKTERERKEKEMGEVSSYPN